MAYIYWAVMLPSAFSGGFLLAANWPFLGANSYYLWRRLWVVNAKSSRNLHQEMANSPQEEKHLKKLKGASPPSRCKPCVWVF
jgi:hypothetical protein